VRKFSHRGEVAPRAEADEGTVRVAAVRLLSRREHSVQELKRKLLGRGYLAERVDRVVDQLAEKRLVSDTRFASSYVRHHAARGQGPIRIRAELRQQSLDEPLIQGELGAAEVDWVSRAIEVRERKFGADRPQTPGERAKQARFLQYRGFSSDQIRAALRREGGVEPDDDASGTDDGVDPER
jgi:regulatory protein